MSDTVSFDELCALIGHQAVQIHTLRKQIAELQAALEQAKAKP